MSFKFPTSGTTASTPTVGSTFGVGTKVWEWNGTVFNLLPRGLTGATGTTGSTGATGAAGATGPVGDFVEFLNGATGSITTEGLTFAFAGISVGASGITVDGDIRLLSGAIGFTTDVDIVAGNVTLARFSRTNTKVTLGDINDDSTSVPTFFELDTKLNLVSVTGGVFFPANGISLGVGLTFPDGSFQSSAHAPHDFVSSFNGATGAIEGVNSFNGATGNIEGVNTFNGATGNIEGVNSFNGLTGAVLGVANGVATFTISASSAIATGQKTDSLHRFPYDGTLTNIDVKVNGSGGFTAGAIIAGPDFGNPATSSVTGGTLGIEGTTGSSTILNNTSVTAGGFMFFDVINNASGSTQAQMFVSYDRR